jgi:hypothetical protein
VYMYICTDRVKVYMYICTDRVYTRTIHTLYARPYLIGHIYRPRPELVRNPYRLPTRVTTRSGTYIITYIKL